MLQTIFMTETISGTKFVDVDGTLRAPSAAEDFRFTIKPDSSIEALNGTSFEIEALNDPSSTGTSGTDAAGAYGFLIKFRDPGTYVFIVEEADGGSPSVDYDSHQYTVKYTVGFEQNETRTVQKLINSDTSDDGSKDFTNTVLPAEIDLFARKTITNGHLLNDNNKIFTFELLDENRSVLQTVKNDTAGLMKFSTLKLYPGSDLTGEYVHKFIITEKIDSPKKSGITYDTNEYSLTITTFYNSDAKQIQIKSIKAVNKNGDIMIDEQASNAGSYDRFLADIGEQMQKYCEFVNSYDPSIPQTGDTSGFAVWMILALASLGCAVSIYLFSDMKSRKKDRAETM